MADFCKQCALDLWGEDGLCDFTNMFKDRNLQPGGGMGFNVLCETCGPAFIIDDDGTCGSTYCDEKHGSTVDG